MDTSFDDDKVNLVVTEDELRLIKKMLEANDSGMLDRRGRLGSLKIRTGLTYKVYQCIDALVGDDDEPEEEGEGD